MQAGESETIYNNMPAFGLGKMGTLVPAAGYRATAASRLAKEDVGPPAVAAEVRVRQPPPRSATGVRSARFQKAEGCPLDEYAEAATSSATPAFPYGANAPDA